MGSLHEINKKRFFTLDEARHLLPVVRRITKAAKEDITLLSTQGRYMSDKRKRAAIEEQIQHVIQNWHQKIQKLGCEAKGMWLVDFDSGEGYFCWHFPEHDIEFFHGYKDGFTARKKLELHPS
ncbi:MAG: DUF2203 domain-containing protein [Deltaproteobacteria bacterium]|nr:DUF2203 domain-containing protein [Deltaproteobacteria bacterium]MBI3293687.1 DUF2203 domain-containing protein [Deltaproteobacteria bacterium]